MAKLTKKTLDGNVDTLILAVLGDGPTYGYDLVRRLNERGGGLLEMGEGTVYPVLHRMEERKLITATWRRASGRPRKYYRVTATGHRALKENAAQWKSLMKLMGDMLNPEARGTPA